MRVALYTFSIASISGKEATIFELVKRSRHKWTIFTSYLDKGSTFREVDDLKVVELSDDWVRDKFLNQKGIIFKSCLNLPRKKLPLTSYDHFFVVTGGISHLVLLSNKLPSSCLCLTPLRSVYDQEFQRAYRQRERLHLVKRYFYFPIFKLLDRFAWRTFLRVFCISREVRDRLVRSRLVDSHKIEIAYPGIDVGKISPSWNFQKYFLLPGRIHWTKNIELGIKAFSKFHSSSPGFQDFKLVIAGKLDETDRGYLDSLKKLAGSRSQFKFVISPSPEELRDLYQNCYAVIFTALNEDFGIVPLEGMAYGKPVVCLNQGGPKETVTDNEAGFLVNNQEELVKALTVLAKDSLHVLKMGEKARKHSFNFDWKYFVEKIDNYLDSQ